MEEETGGGVIWEFFSWGFAIVSETKVRHLPRY